MVAFPPPLHLFLVLFSGWVNREQAKAIDSLKEENRLLHEQLGGRRIRLTDDERRRLAVKGKALSCKLLGEVAGIVTPASWYRRFIAQKYDGSTRRRAGGPRTKPDLVQLIVKMAGENPRWGLRATCIIQSP